MENLFGAVLLLVVTLAIGLGGAALFGIMANGEFEKSGN